MQRRGGQRNWQDITCTWGKGSGNQDKNLPGSHTSQDQSAAKSPEIFHLIDAYHIPVILFNK